MSDETDGQVDILVVGSGRTHYKGLRFEVLSVRNHKLSKRFDSNVSAQGVEFGTSSSGNVDLRQRDHDYDIVFEACAQHMCSEGISGFLVFSGKTGAVSTAKLITRGMGSERTGPPTYDVAFSANTSEDARELLQEAICDSRAISNRPGLPFGCGIP